MSEIVFSNLASKNPLCSGSISSWNWFTDEPGQIDCYQVIVGDNPPYYDCKWILESTACPEGCSSTPPDRDGQYNDEQLNGTCE
jgi:hypothetical protein